jgi:cysteine desulfurase / selenocysteine lyase
MLPPLPPTFNPALEFPILTRHLFLNHAAVAPICARAANALRQYAQQAEQDAYLTGHWYRQAEITRARAAQLINASPKEIAFCKNTSEGLAFVASGLSWKEGDEIISTNVEYPANVYPWMDLAQRFGVKHIMIPETNDGTGARIDPAKILAAITPKTRMLALSHVEYASGFRHHLAPLGQICRQKGILLCIDAIQSAGVLPIDVQAMNIDFLSADGHKWLLSPEGLGIFYCRKDLIPTLHPEVGWMNVTSALDYGHYDFTLRQDAKRFECGSYNIPGVLALGAALELILEIGLPTITARTLALTDQLAAGLAAKGYHIISPRSTESEKSAILAFASPTHDHAQIIRNLEKQNIILVTRENRLRASPHFYNTPDQITQLLTALPSHQT